MAILSGDRIVAALRGGDDPGSVLKRADEALYLSKSAGRDRVTRYEHPA